MPTLTPLTDSQKMKAIASVWSNENKLRIAQLLEGKNLSYPAQIIEETNLKDGLVQKYLKEMVAAGTVEKTNWPDKEKKNMVFYRLTALGRNIVHFLK